MRFWVIKSKHLKYFALVLVAIVLLAITIDGSNSAQVFFGYNVKKTPIYCVQTTEKKVAISFDAAWGADKTQDIMDNLKEFNANATFFLVGFWVDKYPDMTKKIDQSGFEIGTHSNTHPDMTTLSKENMEKELDLSMGLIENAIGKKVTVFRPPYGAYNNTLLEVCTEINLYAIQWDVDSLDWKGLSAENITQRIIGRVKNGSIILCHNNSDHIVEALPMILSRLNQMGYTVCSVGDLIYKQNFSIDRTGMQIQNQG